MGWTKHQIIDEAFEEIGLAAHAYDISPEERESALRKLDAMMANWNLRGIKIGYVTTSEPEDSDPDTDAGISDMAIEAVYKNLAVRLGPSFGKIISQETKKDARRSYNALLAQSAKPDEMVITNLPSGAGRRGLAGNFRNFLPEPKEPDYAGNGDALEFD
jgi:hypothetical protein